MRVQFFEAPGYDTRLYAFENDVLYSYSLPAFFDNGFRYYIVLNYNWHKKIGCSLKWSQTLKRDIISSGSGTEEIAGNKRSELRIQFCYFITN